MTIAFFMEEAALDQVAGLVRQRSVCLLNDLSPSALDGLDDERRPVVVLSFAQSYQWVDYWTTAPRPVVAWLVVPSGMAVHNLTSQHRVADEDVVAGRLLRFLSEVIPRERWLDLNDPWFGKIAALQLCRSAETERLSTEPDQSSSIDFDVLQSAGQQRSSKTFALSVGATYRTAKGAVGLSLLEAGWSHAESTHVWSNGRQASIVLPIKSGDEQAIQCRLTGFHIGRPFRVQVRVNEQPMLHRSFDGQGSKAVELLVPLLAPRRGANPYLRRIELCFSQTWSPSELYANSNDRRELAIALSAISVEAMQDSDAAMLNIVGGLHAAGLGRLIASGTAADDEASSLADIAASDLLEAGPTTPLIVLVDLPQPGPALAGLHGVLGPERGCVYLACLAAGERQHGDVKSAALPSWRSDGPACFADTWDRIVEALRFIERVPDILVAASMGRAIDACDRLAPALGMSAPVRVMIVAGGDSGEIRHHKKYLSGNMEMITVHDEWTVLHAYRQVL